MDNFDYYNVPHNFEPKDIKVYEDVFTQEEQKSIIKYLERPNWRFGHFSSREYRNCPPFWSMPLSKDSFFTEHLLNKIKQKTGDDFDLITVYANGQTYGAGGQPHSDDCTEFGRTFLYYANLAWDVRWNGKTVFIFDNNYHYELPKNNKAVYFPGMIKHFAEETTRTFGGMRMTIAWKVRVK